MGRVPWFALIAFVSGLLGFLLVYEGSLRSAIVDPIAWIILGVIALGTLFWLTIDQMT